MLACYGGQGQGLAGRVGSYIWYLCSQWLAGVWPTLGAWTMCQINESTSSMNTKGVCIFIIT